MNRVVHILQLRSLRTSLHLALLIQRLSLGLLLLVLHGWTKLTGFDGMRTQFVDPWGLGTSATLALVIFAEVVCASLVALGLFTRFAALVCSFNMACAFYLGHGASLTGQNSGELPFVFCIGFVLILLAGPGRFSLDHRLGSGPST